MEGDLDRILKIEIPATLLAKAAPEESWSSANSAFNGWQVLFTPGLVVYWEGTIDLSGYARDYKTFTPAGGVLQNGAYTYEAGSEGTILYTVVSTTPLTPLSVYSQLILLSGPGFLTWGGLGAAAEEQQNPDQIMFAECQTVVPDVNISPNPFGILTGQPPKQSGSMEPTASDTLYCLKMAIPLGVAQTSLGIPASRVILPGTMIQEPELEYLMRLSRSVQLANQN